MGSDFGQWNEWNHDTNLQWDLLQHESHAGIQKLVSDLNAMYRREKALHEVEFEGHGFQWIDCSNRDDCVLTFLRKAKDPDDHLVVCCNNTPVVRRHYRVGVPRPAWYREIFNSDSEYYGGSNVGNFPGVAAEPIGVHSHPHSIEITLPPLAVTVFKPTG